MRNAGKKYLNYENIFVCDKIYFEEKICAYNLSAEEWGI
jgi:hypothetical protein